MVRALPAAATPPGRLPDDLASAWAQALRPARRRTDAGVAVKYVLIGLLKVYRLVISPLYGNVCRYYPSCSAYALRAVEVHGAVRGSWLAGAPAAALPPVGARWVRPGPGHPGVRGGDGEQAARLAGPTPATPRTSTHPSRPHDSATYLQRVN